MNASMGLRTHAGVLVKGIGVWEGLRKDQWLFSELSCAQIVIELSTIRMAHTELL